MVVGLGRENPRSKVNLKVKKDFSTNEGRKKCNTFPRVILIRKSIPYIFSRFMFIFNVKRSTSRSNNRKYEFYQIKLRTCVISHFHGKSFDGIISAIQGDLQGGRVNFKVKFLKILQDEKGNCEVKM